MKRVLVDTRGGICHIVCPGGDERPEAVYVSAEFEVYNGANPSSKWINAPDEVDQFWYLEEGQWVDRTTPWTDPKVARVVAYKSIGEQLDMIYKDQRDGTSKWNEHIAAVKASIPMDPILINNSAQEPIIHGPADPSWTYLPDDDENVTI